MTFKQFLSSTKNRLIFASICAAILAFVCEINAYQATNIYGSYRHSGTSGGACGFAIASGICLLCYTWLEIEEKRRSGGKADPGTKSEDKNELAGP